MIKELGSGHFSSMVHDLKNYLGIIETYTDILANSPDISLENQQCINQIAIATTNAKILINKFDQISKIVNGTISYEIRPFNLSELIENTVQFLRSVASTKEIVIETLLEKNLQVSADQEKIQEVLVNLFMYSFRPSQKGKTISVQAKEVNKKVEIRVIDSGKGVPFIHDLTDSTKKSEKIAENLELFIICTFLNGHGQKLFIQCDEEKERVFSFSLSLPKLENSVK